MMPHKHHIMVFLLCLIYISIVGVLPSMGANLIAILSTFSGTIVDENFLWLILTFEIVFQASFLVIFYLIRDTITRQGLSATCVMLFLVVMLFGSPFLFAVSHQFITMLTNIYSAIAVPAPTYTSDIMIMRASLITPESFWIYSIANLAVSAFFGALLVGLIQPWATSSRAVYTIILPPP
ncbi:MAG: hypothetical protein KAU03_00900 [Candidatus Altiarchaeales archaeon]|nr:hypothetical protein [Candidatus Altiarchaeales archaeon]